MAAAGRFRAKAGQLGRAGGIRASYMAQDGRKRPGPSLGTLTREQALTPARWWRKRRDVA